MRYLYYWFSPLIVVSTEVAAAVDKDSSAYQTGAAFGNIFAAILVILIIRKVFFKKK